METILRNILIPDTKQSKARMSFHILGAGAWGTAMAISLSRGGHEVTLVPRSPEKAGALSIERVNEHYLPGHRLPDGVKVSAWEETESESEAVCLLACPSFGVREWADRLRQRYSTADNSSPTIVSLAKGVDQESLLLPTQVLQEVFPKSCLFALSGPNFAAEVAQGLPAAAVLAGDSMSGELRRLQEAFGTSRFRIYTSDDRCGVELGGALKNVYAVGMGICEGLRLGDNAKAALLTRSLNEMVRLIPLLHGQQETAYGLSGVGDLVATCYGQLSRNRAFGESVGKGESIDSRLKSGQGVVEGYYACRNFYSLFQEHDLNGPILEQLFAVLYKGKLPAEALQALMNRELKPEKPLAMADRP